MINTNFNFPVIILRDADIEKPEILKDNLYEVAITLTKEPQFKNLGDNELEYRKEKLGKHICIKGTFNRILFYRA